MVNRHAVFCALLLMVFSSGGAFAPIQAFAQSGQSAQSEEGGLEILDLRIGLEKNRTRIVIELNKKLTQKTDFNVFILASPYRAVINLPAAHWKIAETDNKKGLVTDVRYGLFSEQQSRVVLDLKAPAKIQKQFMLPPSANNQNTRLVVDLVPIMAREFNRAKLPQQVERAQRTKSAQIIAPPSLTPLTPLTPKTRPKRDRKVIVIDPGHGGVDPGAHGRQAKEKNVVLSFAKQLIGKLRDTGLYDVYLTRNTDVYIPLRARVQIARRKKADLFISIHADAIKKRNVRGLSVYTLSEKASDKEAAALARKENQSDIIAGIDFGDQPKDVTNILIDLAQRETKNLSKRFAASVVKETRGKTRLLERTHRQAGFRVLKAPDVPSVLIELGFLTNRADEKQLLSAKWQRNVATALTQAVGRYFREKQRLAQP